MFQGKSCNVCLHVSDKDMLWVMLEGFKPKKLKVSSYLERIANDELLSSITYKYRIIGTPENFEAILRLYELITFNKLNASLHVGCPSICRDYHSEVSEFLDCFGDISPAESTYNYWQLVTPSSYESFRLAHYSKLWGSGVLLYNVYDKHCITKYLKFLGVHSQEAGINFISSVLDPRWYINASRPERMSRAESKFGLKSNDFKVISKDGLLTSRLVKSKNCLTLYDMLKRLPPDSVFHRECNFSNSQLKLEHCFVELKWLLHFLLRTWLQELGIGQFVPEKFFKHTSSVQAYNSMT